MIKAIFSDIGCDQKQGVQAGIIETFTNKSAGCQKHTFLIQRLKQIVKNEIIPAFIYVQSIIQFLNRDIHGLGNLDTIDHITDIS